MLIKQFENVNKLAHNLTSKKLLKKIHKSFSWFNQKEKILKEQNEEDKSKPKVAHLKEEDSKNNPEEIKKDMESIFGLEEANKYTEERVKKFDFYAFVIGKALPEKIKPHYFAYHAFYLEILKSRYISKELSVNRMRLLFWEESLKEIIAGDKVIKEPMMIALKETLKITGIRKDTLFRLIDFQYYDIERHGEIQNIEELEIFAENTRSLIFYLTLNLFHIDDKDAFIAASHLGRGIGMVDVLKKMPSLLKMHINQLPEIITKNGASSYNLWDRHGQIKEELFDSVLEVAAYAKKHIEIARTYNGKLPKNTNLVFLQAVESYQWLLDLEKYNFDIFEPNLAKLSTYGIPREMIDFGKKGLF